MTFHRVIINGKLETRAELVGGPSDGLFVITSLPEVIIQTAKPLMPTIEEVPISMPERNTHVYKRISANKYAYEGLR